MNVFSKLLTVFTLLTPFFSASASPEFLRPEAYEDRRDYALEAGYFIQRSLLDDTFFQYETTQRYFNKLKMQSPYSVTSPMLTYFDPIINSLDTYIQEQKKGTMSLCEENTAKCSKTFESVNGITERELATEITKASYCFGTDPFVVTSKIRQESRFDMTSISNTGAIGLTQLTAPGLKEVLDQLGHRGPKYAFMDNKEFLMSATECYMQQALSETLRDFPQVKTVALKSGRIEYTAETIASIKAWVLPRTSAGSVAFKDRKILIQRQLFLGQILLKIYLAYSKQVKKNQPMMKHYEAALRMFNGDDIRVRYAKEVIKFSKQAQAL